MQLLRLESVWAACYQWERIGYLKLQPALLHSGGVCSCGPIRYTTGTRGTFWRVQAQDGACFKGHGWSTTHMAQLLGGELVSLYVSGLKDLRDC